MLNNNYQLQKRKTKLFYDFIDLDIGSPSRRDRNILDLNNKEHTMNFGIGFRADIVGIWSRMSLRNKVRGSSLNSFIKTFGHLLFQREVWEASV